MSDWYNQNERGVAINNSSRQHRERRWRISLIVQKEIAILAKVTAISFCRF